jgi:hypothetical protein
MTTRLRFLGVASYEVVSPRTRFLIDPLPATRWRKRANVETGCTFLTPKVGDVIVTNGREAHIEADSP